VAWIPQKLLAATLSLPFADREAVEQVIDDVILPDNTKSLEERGRSLISLCASLTEDRASHALSKLLSEREEAQRSINSLVASLERKEGVKGVAVQRHLAVLSHLVPVERAEEYSRRLYKLKGGAKLFRQLAKLCSPTVTRKEGKGVVKGVGVIVAQSDQAVAPFAEALAEKLRFKIVCPTVTKKAIELLAEEEEDDEKFLEIISNSAPSLIAPHLEALVPLVGDLKSSLSTAVLSALSACVPLAIARDSPLVEESKATKKAKKALVGLCGTTKHTQVVKKAISAIRVLSSLQSFEKAMKELTVLFHKQLSSLPLIALCGLALILKLSPAAVSPSRLVTLSKFTLAGTKTKKLKKY
jgi:hypothetical protein